MMPKRIGSRPALGRPLRVAILGTRGLPATFGGVERHVEEVGARLASRGHEIVVYGRSNYVDRSLVEYRGMTQFPIGTVNSKHLEAVVHTARAAALARRGFDIVHFHAIGPGLLTPFTRAFSRSRVVQSIHGLDGERAKWGATASGLLKLGTWLSAKTPHATTVVSHALADHYRQKYGRETTYVTNGAPDATIVPRGEVHDRLDIGGRPYVLFVGRLVPEKCPDLLIRAFGQMDVDADLVIAGGSSHTEGYQERLRSLASVDPRIKFPGYTYDTDLAALYSNASVFVNPSRLEGLPITLLEAAAYGCPVVLSDIAPHREIVGAGGDGPGHRLFVDGSVDALAAAIADTLDDDQAAIRGAKELHARVADEYTWDAAADVTESLYYSLINATFAET